jgi:hypothetical protein
MRHEGIKDMIVLLASGIPPECMAGTFSSHGWVALVVTFAGFLGAIYSLFRGFQWLWEDADPERYKKTAHNRHIAKSWLLGLWVLLPPLWFYIEAIFLYRHFGKAACFESFHDAQGIVMEGWIVLVAVLAGLYFGKEVFGGTKTSK